MARDNEKKTATLDSTTVEKKTSQTSRRTAKVGTKKTSADTVKKKRTASVTKKIDSASRQATKQDTIPLAKTNEETSETRSEQYKVRKAFGLRKHQPIPQTVEGVLGNLVQQLLQEQRSNRRWGIVFKTAAFVALFSFLYLVFFLSEDSSTSTMPGFTRLQDEEFTAVVDVSGVIASGEFAGADSVIEQLTQAFEHQGTRGVLLDINSPGGSPVQAGQIYDEILRLREEYPDTKVYAVISDLGASGAYYIAAAADEIYADKSSLVGSIGVIYSGFGFTELMQDIGVERRLVTAGRNKAFLDPFSPESEEMNDFWQSVLDQTHQQFIESVLKTRGDKITDRTDVFSGLVYNGEKALELGLIDNLGDKRYVAREVIGYEEMRHFYNEEQNWLQWAKQFGVVAASAFSAALQSQVSILR